METRYLHNAEAGDAHIVVMYPYRDVMATILFALSRADCSRCHPPVWLLMWQRIAVAISCGITSGWGVIFPPVNLSDSDAILTFTSRRAKYGTPLFYSIFIFILFYLASDNVFFLLSPEISVRLLHIISAHIFAPNVNQNDDAFLLSGFISPIFSDMTLSRSLFLVCSWSARILGAWNSLVSFYVFTWIFILPFVYRLFLQKSYCSLNRLGRDFLLTLCYTFKQFFVLRC